MFRILQDYILTFFALLSGFLLLGQFSDKYWGKINDASQVSVLIIGFMFFWYFISSLYMKAKWGRERKYAQTIDLLGSGFSELHKLNRVKDYDYQKAITACDKLLSSLATAITMVSGTTCCATIKILVTNETESSDPDNFKLSTLTFSRSSLQRKTEDKKVNHWIHQNTDFLEILKNIDKRKGISFFRNWLPFSFGYQNTSFQIYGTPSENVFLRYFRWPLPYKSTIVVPICPCDSQNTKNLVGFLCVDSGKLGAFRKNYDVQLIQGVADGLYNVINKVMTSPDIKNN